MAQQQQTVDNSDIPVNKAVLMGIGVIAAAFSFFQLSSCTSNFISTPEFVQAIQACNASVQIPVTIDINPNTNNDNKKFDIAVTASPEVLASLEKCHANTLEKFRSVPKPTLNPLPKL